MAAVVAAVLPFSSSSSSSPGQLQFVGKDIARLFHPLASTPFPSTGQNTWIDGYDSSCTKLSVQAPPTPPCFNWRSSSSRTRVSFFQSLFVTKEEDVESLKQELLQAISPLDRGADATLEDQERVDQIACKLEAVNKVKEPLNSSFLNGKWELLYTTSMSILKAERPKFLRPNGKIYQAINADTLRAQNMETWPFFNQATANLVPLNARRVAVKFDSFKIAGVIPIKARGSGRGQLEITYLDEEFRISRGNQGNLFILRMVDSSYRVPL